MAKIEAYKVKEYIIDNPDLIPVLLNRAGFSDIEEYKADEYRCAWEDGLNPTAVSVNVDTLTSHAYSMNVSGDIISLIQEKMKLSFHSTLKYICEVCNIKLDDMQPDFEVELPFGGYYKNIGKLINDDYEELKVYPSEILTTYGNVVSLKFYKDMIDELSHNKYGVGYDTCTDRITVPWFNLKNELIGIMGRKNGDLNEGEAKWFPVIPFPKSQVLFGLNENYNVIKEKSTMIIFESEKSPMQCSSFGLNTCVALGGNSLSKWHVNTIKSMFLDDIIIAMDEGLDEEHSRKLAEQLKMDGFFKNRCSYIYDRENKYMKKGSKISPSDAGIEVFKSLMKECRVYV